MSALRFVCFCLCLAVSAACGAADGGFTSLLNGKDLSGWTMLPGKQPAFAVVDGLLETRVPGGSDLFTVARYGNYVLRFEYLLSKVGNSGVLIRCDPKNPWGTGVEVQLLAPWTPYRDDLHCTGSLYGHVAVTNRPDETTGVWHRMEIRCDRNVIEVSVDGRRTTVADTRAVKALDAKLLSGVIGFQSNHSKQGEFAQFRKIEIRDLDKEPDYVLAGFSQKDERFRVQAREAAAALGPAMIVPLARVMEGDAAMARSVARQALFDIVAAASAPQAEAAARDAAARALREALGAKPSESTAGYVSWLSGMLRK
ncbi:MAG TPA: DUF1080 domain-containing protein [Kiritimatiellia bacterium]|nr:DUF1080 domain-containing protein [Kiritimatiellia bacterium]